MRIKKSKMNWRNKTCKDTGLFAILYKALGKAWICQNINKGGKRNGIIKRMAQNCL